MLGPVIEGAGLGRTKRGGAGCGVVALKVEVKDGGALAL